MAAQELLCRGDKQYSEVSYAACRYALLRHPPERPVPDPADEEPCTYLFIIPLLLTAVRDWRLREIL